VITDGLKSGERVIVDGVQKARGGHVVDPKPAKALADKTPSA
jgi:multidrug efflux pump subunit AcrA (membrane-fusion protein)